MAARAIPIERLRPVAVWPQEALPRYPAPREDRLIAICIPVPLRARVTVQGAEPAADWPAPALNALTREQ